jgi:beta-glucosidase
MPGNGSWASAYSKAVALVSQMTLAEKANLTVGQAADNGCSGVIGSVPRLNFPGLCLSDAGNGLRNTDFVNSWPSGLHVGASWNKNLSYQRGYNMGGEFKAKGVNVALGPVVGPLGRVSLGGRNWEGMGNDRKCTFPWLLEYGGRLQNGLRLQDLTGCISTEISLIMFTL